MNFFVSKALNRSRRLLGHETYRDSEGERLPIQFEGPEASALLYEAMTADAPCMVSRLGRLELILIRRYWFQITGNPFTNTLDYVRGKKGRFWWDPVNHETIMKQAGVFSNDKKSLERFCQLYLDDMPEIDILGSWCPGEPDVAEKLQSAKTVPLPSLEAYRYEQPWIRGLKGKSVLVIHPFESTIRSQYAKREKLFTNPDALPEFDLHTIPAVQSIGGNGGEYATWFDALDSMIQKMSDVDFDVVLIGAGAYGLPLAAAAKRMGKKAVHVGGALQLFFGIRGNRWDGQDVVTRHYNEHWARPSDQEKPKASKEVEDACYW